MLYSNVATGWTLCSKDVFLYFTVGHHYFYISEIVETAKAFSVCNDTPFTGKEKDTRASLASRKRLTENCWRGL